MPLNMHVQVANIATLINDMQVVQDTVVEAVQDAVTAAFEESGRFDVRANFYTLIAITGVVLYWRGIWNSW